MSGVYRAWDFSDFQWNLQSHQLEETSLCWKPTAAYSEIWNGKNVEPRDMFYRYSQDKTGF